MLLPANPGVLSGDASLRITHSAPGLGGFRVVSEDPTASPQHPPGHRLPRISEIDSHPPHMTGF